MGPSMTSGCTVGGVLLIPLLILDFLGLIVGFLNLNFKTALTVTLLSLLNTGIIWVVSFYW